jgi:DNA-3-methyladenine glycosylase II
LQSLDDDEARDELTQVKGVGRFTADAVFMLALRRPDVWPAADLALRRAVERFWALDAPASVAQVDAIGERFRPWRTLAATYLYRTLNSWT